MQAIIKVSRTSSFNQLNGHTFKVKEVMYSNNSAPMFALNINGNTTDFSAKEVIIVSLSIEMIINRDTNIGEALKAYATINKIQL
jgi:hypothetical protein